MAILAAEVLKLTADDVRLIDGLERNIDDYLSSNWAGPERPFDTNITDLKWSVCEELRRRYRTMGWDVGFRHPVSLGTTSFGSLLDGPTKPKSLPTLIIFNPLLGDGKITKKKIKKVKGKARK